MIEIAGALHCIRSLVYSFVGLFEDKLSQNDNIDVLYIQELLKMVSTVETRIIKESAANFVGSFYLFENQSYYDLYDYYGYLIYTQNYIQESNNILNNEYVQNLYKEECNKFDNYMSISEAIDIIQNIK